MDGEIYKVSIEGAYRVRLDETGNCEPYMLASRARLLAAALIAAADYIDGKPPGFAPISV